MDICSSYGRFVLFIALLLGVIALPSGSVYAQNTSLTLDVRIGFDGWVQTDAWVPIQVLAENNGPDLTGEIRVEVVPLAGGRTTYSRLIDLPQGSRKLVTIYATEVSPFAGDISVDLIQRGRVVATEQVQAEFISPNVLLVGLWSDNPGAMVSVARTIPDPSRIALAVITEDDLPDLSEGWAALDVLVVSDADSGQLSPAQREALKAWIYGGGRLIITGGSNFQKTLAGLADLSPMTLNDTASASLEPLILAAGIPFEPNANLEGLVATGPVTDGAIVMLADGDVPLVAYREFGSGRVDLFTPDPALEPILSWAGTPALWFVLLSDGSQRPAWSYGFNGQWQEARSAVADLPGVTLPSILQLCGFLGLYFALIGPVNYLVLNRLRRREWAWFTIPGLVLIFAVVAYVTGFRVRGSQPVLHRLAIVQTWTGSDIARVDALLGLWSPRRAGYDIALDPGLLAFPLPRDFAGALTTVSEATVREGETALLENVRVDIGSIQPFVVGGYLTDVPRIEGQIELTRVGDGVRLTGDVTNYSPVDFENVSLLFAGLAADLPNLPAGEVIQIDELMAGGRAVPAGAGGINPYPGSATAGLPYIGSYTPLVIDITNTEDCWNSLDANRRRCNLTSAVLTGEGRGSAVYLTAWTDRTPLETSIINSNAENVDIALYIVELTTRLSGTEDQEAVEIPPGLMTYQPIDSFSTGLTPYDLYLYSSDEAYGFRFEPVDLIGGFTAQEVRISVQPGYTQEGQPTIEAYNVRADRWDLIGIEWGTLTLNDPEQYLDAGGGVAVRVSLDSDSHSISIERLEVYMIGR